MCHYSVLATGSQRVSRLSTKPSLALQVQILHFLRVARHRLRGPGSRPGQGLRSSDNPGGIQVDLPSPSGSAAPDAQCRRPCRGGGCFPQWTGRPIVGQGSVRRNRRFELCRDKSVWSPSRPQLQLLFRQQRSRWGQMACQ